MFISEEFRNSFLSLEADVVVAIIIGLFTLPGIHVKKVFNFQRDAIKYLLAQKNNWTYNPDYNTFHWEVFAKKFPDFFALGTHAQNFQDEFWGSFQKEKSLINFYAGVFEYKKTSGSGKNRRTSIYYETFFSFQLPKVLKSEFQLLPKFWLRSVLSNNKIEFASVEFNKHFDCYYENKNNNDDLETIKILSPALIEKLIQAVKKEKGLSIIFKEDLVVFKVSGKMLKKMKTNFFSKIEINPADEIKLKERMDSFINIALEMEKYLK